MTISQCLLYLFPMRTLVGSLGHLRKPLEPNVEMSQQRKSLVPSNNSFTVFSSCSRQNYYDLLYNYLIKTKLVSCLSIVGYISIVDRVKISYILFLSPTFLAATSCVTFPRNYNHSRSKLLTSWMWLDYILKRIPSNSVRHNFKIHKYKDNF